MPTYLRLLEYARDLLHSSQKLTSPERRPRAQPQHLLPRPRLRALLRLALRATAVPLHIREPYPEAGHASAATGAEGHHPVTSARLGR
jgi:hypothetical protein